MLVLTRSRGESVVLEGHGTVTVVGWTRDGYVILDVLPNGRPGGVARWVLPPGKHVDVDLGPDITIALKEVRLGEARLGFTAPRSVTIYRSELADRQPKERLTR